MNHSESQRIGEGKDLLQEHLAKVSERAEVFLGALQGFRRDLETSLQSVPKYMEAEFLNPAHLIAVPQFFDGKSFSDLVKMLDLSVEALDGKLKVTHPKTPPVGPAQNEKKQLLEEISITHKNLLDVADSAHRLYEAVRTALFEFDVFNSKNNDVGFHEADIMFYRDSINLAMSTARALSERAVRLDIDLCDTFS